MNSLHVDGKTIHILVFTFIVLLSGCTSVFFQPQKAHINNPLLDNLAYEDIYFRSADDVLLHGWHLKSGREGFGTILHLHGNAENISTHISSVLWLVDEGFDIFTFDYRGYGKSEGVPSVKGVHLDAEAALEIALSLSRASNRDRLIVLGQSIGGAIAVYTVANSPNRGYIRALILDSTFAGYRFIAREKLADLIITYPFQYPLSLLIDDEFSPVKWIKKVSPTPVLFIHGEYDKVVPVHHSEVLYEAASVPKDIWVTSVEGHIRSLSDNKIREKLIKYLLLY